MATQDAIRLCSFIIRDDFGPIVSSVATTLLVRGRLRIGGIRQFIPDKDISIKQIKQSLVVLIQHSLCMRSEFPDRGIMMDYYEMEPHAILARMRIPRILAYSEARFGKTSTLIIEHLFRQGRAKYSDIVNFIDETSHVKKEECVKVLDRLLDHDFIQARDAKSTESKEDKRIKLEARKVANHSSRILTPKERKEITQEVNAELAEEETRFNEGIKTGLKNKLSRSGENSHDRRHAYFRINMSRFALCLRDDMLITAVEEKYNMVMAEVMKEALGLAEILNTNSLNAEKSDSFSLTKLLSVVVARKIPIEHAFRGNKRGELINGAEKRPQLRRILDTLQQRPYHFVEPEAQKDELYYIPFQKMAIMLKKEVLETFIAEKHGHYALRLMRIILEKEKVEEKWLANLAFIPQKDVREQLGKLAVQGFIDLQEVPKTNDRMTSRAHLLWFVNEKKCFSLLLKQLYKTAANLRQRRQFETEQRQTLEDKLSRSDVKENPQLLSEKERADAHALEEMLAKLEVQEQRIEQMIFVVRDIGLAEE